MLLCIPVIVVEIGMLVPVLPQLKHHPVCNVDLAAAITTIINIMIIWTLGVVLHPGTRTGSRGEVGD